MGPLEINFAARGIFYDTDFNETIPTDLPIIPYKYPVGLPTSRAQIFIAQQTISGILDSFLQVHPINGWFNSTEIPAGSKFQLNTGLEKAFKGISDYCGPD